MALPVSLALFDATSARHAAEELGITCMLGQPYVRRQLPITLKEIAQQPVIGQNASLEKQLAAIQLDSQFAMHP